MAGAQLGGRRVVSQRNGGARQARPIDGETSEGRWSNSIYESEPADSLARRGPLGYVRRVAGIGKNGSGRDESAPVRLVLGALTLLGCISFADLKDARAQSAAPPTLRNTVPITLVSGRPGLELSIWPDGDTRYGQRCESWCNLALVPGLYEVGVAENGVSSSRRIRIREPERLTLTPPSSEARDIGSGLAIGGLVLGGLGSAAFLYGVARAIPCAYADGSGSNCPEHPQTLIFVGLAGMAAGLAVGIPGIVLVLKNRGPRVDVERFDRDANARSPSLYFRLSSAGAPLGLRFGAEF